MKRLVFLLIVVVLPAAGAWGQQAGHLGFTDITKGPTSVEVVLADTTAALTSTAQGKWSGNGVVLMVKNGNAGGSEISLNAPGVAVKKLHLHWDETFDSAALFLGDKWERAYADLEWKPIDKSGAMPWYFLVSHGSETDGYGVMTGPAAFCCWKVDGKGIDLWADVRSGSVGVELGDRTLAVCTIIDRQGRDDESAFAAAGAFCRQMCPHPRTTGQPVYGFNDWYCAYGADTAEGFLHDAAYIASLSPTKTNKPYMVVDDGWQANRQGGKSGSNQWTRTNAKFGSTMPDLARAVKAMGARPGLWYRPLEAWPDVPPEWKLKGRKNSLDPSNPAVLHVIGENIQRFGKWGFDLVKHDYSSNEITGSWGKDWQDEVPLDGVIFSDKSKTTAEIVLGLYQTLRTAAGDGMLLDGCNTFTHLSAGIFDLNRIGDDTSGQEWGRTRTMGVNCLAFRGFQYNTFYLAYADCAGLAKADAVPWDKNSQWLDLLARSGTPLFVSWPKRLVGPEQERALRAALTAAAAPQPLGEPLDWMKTKTPQQWKLDGPTATFQW